MGYYRIHKKTVLIVFGTRPEAIKMCPLVNELHMRPDMDVKVCVTGQHREMLDQVLDIFSVVPDYDLSVMKNGQDLFDITEIVLRGMKSILSETQPDIVLVHGDTSTAFVTALASYYNKIPVGHVEAGLRTNNIYSPFPEEFNRTSIGTIAALHFAPTEKARDNLIAEGKDENNIFVTGNTVIDAIRATVHDDYKHELLDWAGSKKLILITAHRRENIGKPMKSMFHAIRRVMTSFPDVRAIFPIHLNPKVRQTALQLFGDCPNIRLIEPMDVTDFHNIMKRCYLVLTDSGGIQEEASFLQKPVLVMRDTTERPEGLEAGALKLAGTGEESIFSLCKQLLTDSNLYAKMSRASNPYGDGRTSQRIASILEWFLFESKGQYEIR